MNLDVGMYVRFKDKRGNQYIRKITSVNIKYPDKRYAGVYIDKDANNVTGVSLKNIIKASYNIIDLIEIGDYVNGYKVIGFDESYFNGLDRRKEPMKIGIIIENGKFNFENRIKKEDIKTILTKEQFENNCYKVIEN